MQSINPSASEVIAELEARTQDRTYFGTFTVVLRGGAVAQVRDDRVLAVSKQDRKDTFSNGNRF